VWAGTRDIRRKNKNSKRDVHSPQVFLKQKGGGSFFIAFFGVSQLQGLVDYCLLTIGPGSSKTRGNFLALAVVFALISAVMSAIAVGVCYCRCRYYVAGGR
jgi:hypothetical protein